MSKIKYTVMWEDYEGIIPISEEIRTPEEARKAALESIEELDEKGDTDTRVYVKFFRASDQQHGYLNSDMNHGITGKDWRD